ncbi:hypothetical protein [Brachybacterium vulturis]|uniref:hypothetical protein n=1 Tax=Brachybacterium vulturis TaxID=2017484 RepID=UPI003736A59E
MSSLTDSRWRVHPIGRAATLRRAAAEAMLWGLMGLVGLFAIGFLSGIVAEEVLPESEAATTLDLVTRASLVGDLALGLTGLLALGLLGALEGPLMARALAGAMRRGAPATAVPFPLQWEAARESSARTYRLIAIWLLAILGFCYVIVVFAVFESGLDPTGLAILGGGALLLAVIWAGIPLTGRVFRRWQSRHFEELPRWWTQPHRIIAAGRELTEQDVTAARSRAGLGVALPGAGVRRLVTALVAIITVSAIAWEMAFTLTVGIAYPDATRTASRQLGERADLEPETERLVDLLAMGMGVAGGVALLAVAGIVVCTIILRRLEHRVLRRALAEPATIPPAHALLSRAMAPTSLTILKVLFAVAGAAAALGIALWFVDAVAELPDWDFYAAAGPELRAAGALGPWIVLGALVVFVLGIVVSSVLDARDQGLRDELVQRWPVRPVEEDGAAEDTAETEEPGESEKSQP